MTRIAEKKMAEFVGHHATEEDGKVGVGALAVGAARDLFVVNGGENEDRGGGEFGVLEFVGAGDEAETGSLHVPALLAEVLESGTSGSSRHSIKAACAPATPRILLASRSAAASVAGETWT